MWYLKGKIEKNVAKLATEFLHFARIRLGQVQQIPPPDVIQEDALRLGDSIQVCSRQKESHIAIDVRQPPRIALEPHAHQWSEEKLEECREMYAHPLWKQVGELAKRVGGHGGMDYIMDYRLIHCLRNDLPLDMDVYDAAAWSAVCELSEISTANRSKSVDFPDFTRGKWKTMEPLGIVTVS